MYIIFSIFGNKSHFTYLKYHTQNPRIPPNNLNKGKREENIFVCYRAFNIDRKASINSFKERYLLTQIYQFCNNQ